MNSRLEMCCHNTTNSPKVFTRGLAIELYPIFTLKILSSPSINIQQWSLNVLFRNCVVVVVVLQYGCGCVCSNGGCISKDKNKVGIG